MKNEHVEHNKRLLFYSLIVAAVVFLVIATYFGPSLSRIKQAFWGDEALACSELPSATIRQGKEEQLRILDGQVYETTGSTSFVEFDTQRCPGKGELFIGYGSENDKPTLIKLWQASGLRNIPVHWRNV